jgi:hypothetical protein
MSQRDFQKEMKTFFKSSRTEYKIVSLCTSVPRLRLASLEVYKR